MTTKDVRIEVALGVLWREEKAGPELLIARRPDETVMGGYWEFPGGKVEGGESPRGCVVRELEEELGVVVTAEATIAVIEHDYDHASVRLHAFDCELVSGTPENLGVAEHQWIRPKGLSGYRFLPANGPLLERIVQRGGPVSE
ncbi:MAG: (deoxy)nucleoside triphosphate pyrophosphohydrolase [Phycisphaeraceae bacterium]|nr:(deoxy)nucleoside triphosphate pyrophosphohydrolase [Phycisphaeraceae bacterium]